MVAHPLLAKKAEQRLGIESAKSWQGFLGILVHDSLIIPQRKPIGSEKKFEDLIAIQNILHGKLVSLNSVDTFMNQDDVETYSTEFLNLLEYPGLPPHHLQ